MGQKRYGGHAVALGSDPLTSSRKRSGRGKGQGPADRARDPRLDATGDGESAPSRASSIRLAWGDDGAPAPAGFEEGDVIDAAMAA